ncbi:MAG TPA: XdhC family protein [Acidimicrobiales bacterium]
MHGVAAAVGAWLDAGEDPVVVRVPLAEGIGGAGPGDVLAFGPAGRRVGALLGGAVDDVAARLVDQVRATGQRQVESVQITNQVAAAHGLTCGGLVTVVADAAAALPFDWRAGRAPMVFAGPLGAGGPITPVTADHAGTFVGDAAARVLRGGRSGACLVDQTSLVEVYVPTTRLLVVGGGDLAAALAVQAGVVGLGDRRLGRCQRRGAASERLGVSDAVVVLSHDPTVDTPVLVAALAAGVGYVGALGSRRTQEKRRERLTAAGATDEDLDALRGPAGLDLGGTTASEVALSICAEVLAIRNGRPPLSLRATSGPIHR